MSSWRIQAIRYVVNLLQLELFLICFISGYGYAYRLREESSNVY